jgi:cell division protein FtsZ
MLKPIMHNMGYALIGSGVAEGDDRAIKGSQSSYDNPFLLTSDLQGCNLYF